LQLGFATPNYLIQEAVRLDVPWRDEVVDSLIKIERGTAYVPASPGLGIEINEKAAAKYPYQPDLEMPAFHRDGSVADW
jgi:galactonate dehydratase